MIILQGSQALLLGPPPHVRLRPDRQWVWLLYGGLRQAHRLGARHVGEDWRGLKRTVAFRHQLKRGGAIPFREERPDPLMIGRRSIQRCWTTVAWTQIYIYIYVYVNLSCLFAEFVPSVHNRHYSFGHINWNSCKFLILIQAAFN